MNWTCIPGLSCASFVLAGIPAASASEGRVLTVSRVIPDAAFRTIQDAVNAARPGDTVLVHGGLYNESITFPRSGDPGRPITVRAHPGHIVSVVPGRPLDGRAVAVRGLPNVFRWQGFRPPDDLTKFGIWEASSHVRLTRTYSTAACETRLGSWYYDEQEASLFLRSTGLAPAKDLTYFLVDSRRNAFTVEKGRSHIAIDGIEVAFAATGVHISRGTSHVIVQNCRLFCNRVAGVHLTGEHHVIASNECFRNNHYGIQMRYGLVYCRVVGNRCYYNGPNNGVPTGSSVQCDISLYSRGHHVFVENNVVDGLHQYAVRNKYGANSSMIFRHNVVRGHFYWQAPCVENNTIIVSGLGTRFGMYINRVHSDYEMDLDVIDPRRTQRRSNIFYTAIHKEEPHFADPTWRDFRLQAKSPYHGRGAWPGYAPILYVDPRNGHDDHDGLNTDTALKTLGQALSMLHPDYTVYLMPGTYEEPLTLGSRKKDNLYLGGRSAEEPLVFRAYGKSPDVVLTGGVTLDKCSHVVFEGLTIANRLVSISGATDVRLRECVVDNPRTAIKIAGSRGISLSHVTIARSKTGLRIMESCETSVTNSLFAATTTAVEIDRESLRAFYSEHNHYSTFRAVVDGKALTDLANWSKKTHGSQFDSTGAVELVEGYALPSGSALSFAASDFTHVGARPERPADRLTVRNLRVAAVSPISATLLWETPRCMTESEVEVRELADGTTTVVDPKNTFQIMGQYFDRTFRISGFYTADRQASLSGLKSGREYEATVAVRNVESTSCHRVRVRFTTPRRYATPCTFHVSPEGDDAADGTSPSTAWRTFRQAAAAAGPGDRVLVLPGVYTEILRPRTSGTRRRPIVFESAEPRKAVIDLVKQLPAGIEVMNVDHVHVRGFRLKGGTFSMGHNVVVGHSRGIKISGCHVTFPEGSSMSALKLGQGGMVATWAPDLQVEHNVFLCGYVGISMGDCPGAKVINNTILGEGNYGIVVIPGREKESYVLKDNILYRPVMGYKVGAAITVYNRNCDLVSDHNLFHIPKSFKGTIGALFDTGRIKKLADWQKLTGLDQHSVEAKPLFVAPDRGDFRLKPGSPGIAAADDGGPVGARP